MDKIRFQITEDGSVGLYDYETEDIFHSVTGAYRESYEKFVLAGGLEEFSKTNNDIKILDICYGIGYNTKTAINSVLKINQDIKITVDSLEYNPNVACLSPFIKDNINNISLKIELIKILSEKIEGFYRFIYDFYSKHPDYRDLYSDPSVCPIIDFILSGDNINHIDDISALLHNIYYQNISNSMENCMHVNNTFKLDFDIKIGDARQTINEFNKLYDFVFLDAFTPSKQPILWTKQFFEKIKSKMNKNSVLATYSNASPVRKMLLDLGFNISKTVIDGKSFGTVATPGNKILGTPLDEYELGLLTTRSGIPYLDNETLTLSSEEILNNRLEIMKNSDLISSTQYIKKVKNETQI